MSFFIRDLLGIGIVRFPQIEWYNFRLRSPHRLPGGGRVPPESLTPSCLRCVGRLPFSHLPRTSLSQTRVRGGCRVLTPFPSSSPSRPCPLSLQRQSDAGHLGDRGLA